ncbi:MAG: hypothetical protein AMXMBFR13_18810 [Phycisphaerae bacterium]
MFSTGYPAKPHEFLLRRLHSLAGLIPVGAFLLVHLGSNAMVAFNSDEQDYYQQQVERIHALGPLLTTVEIVFIFIPLGFHAALGVKMWLQGQPNASSYPFWGNFRYTLQRITGMIALVFILFHLYHMHWLGSYFPGPGAQFDPHRATATTAWALQNDVYRLWAPPFYLLGILCSVFHFANGIWTGLITWGITVGRSAQRKAGYACAVFGIALALVGGAALNGFMRYPHPEPPVEEYKPPGAQDGQAS